MQTDPTLPEDDTYNTADAEAVNKQRKKAGRTRAERLKFVEAAMTTVQGRAWFYDIIVRCKTFSTAFSEDVNRTFFNLGLQNVGLQILDDIQTAAPKQYIVMIEENKSKNG